MNSIRTYTIFLITLLSGLTASASAQSIATEPTATISGRITIDGQPVVGVDVMLRPDTGGMPGYDSGPPMASAVTDAEGHYQLAHIAPGRFRVCAYAPAYVISEESNPMVPGKLVAVAEGEVVDGINLTLVRGGVISGKVVNPRGYPAAMGDRKAGLQKRKRNRVNL